MRYQYLDILRWLAITLMVVFHLNHILVYVFDSNILNFSELFWYIIGRIAAFGFIIIAGISFYLASQKYRREDLTRKYFTYALIIALNACAITLTTAVFFPSQIILFWILHFFACSFVLLPIVTRSRFLVLWILIMGFILSWYLPREIESWLFFSLGFVSESFYSADYYPIIPYFLLILFGYFLWEILDNKKLFQYLHVKRELLVVEKILSTAGKYSLITYMVHVPIIYFLIFIF